jgi:hypothetical protein
LSVHHVLGGTVQLVQLATVEGFLHSLFFIIIITNKFSPTF